jgi:hemerythrin-like domain-containing protein
MNPTGKLMEEHRLIETVLDCLDAMADKAARERRLDEPAVRDAVDFFRNYADGCHHDKEEHQLFPLMEERGFSVHEGPTAVMRDEHVQGRELVKSLERALPDDVDAFVEAARAYSRLLRDHIVKEDRCLFPMAGQALSKDDREELGRRFEELERGAQKGAEEKYRSLARRLAESFGVELTEAGHPVG